MVNFCLKVAQIGDLSSKIQWFEALARGRGRGPRIIESYMINLQFELLLGRN